MSHNLSMRRRTNSKAQLLEKRLPKIMRFHRRLRGLLKEPARRPGFLAVEAGVRQGIKVAQQHPPDPAYGRFQLSERFNANQVPLAFVNGQLQTRAERGSKRVQVSQPFAGLYQRQCNVQPTIWAGDKLLRCTVIFRGGGESIAAAERRMTRTLTLPGVCMGGQRDLEKLPQESRERWGPYAYRAIYFVFMDNLHRQTTKNPISSFSSNATRFCGFVVLVVPTRFNR